MAPECTEPSGAVEGKANASGSDTESMTESSPSLSPKHEAEVLSHDNPAPIHKLHCLTEKERLAKRARRDKRTEMFIESVLRYAPEGSDDLDDAESSSVISYHPVELPYEFMQRYQSSNHEDPEAEIFMTPFQLPNDPARIDEDEYIALYNRYPPIPDPSDEIIERQMLEVQNAIQQLDVPGGSDLFHRQTEFAQHLCNDEIEFYTRQVERREVELNELYEKIAKGNAMLKEAKYKKERLESYLLRTQQG